LNEASTPAAVALLSSGRPLHAPGLLLVEVAAAIARRCREGVLDERGARMQLQRAERVLAVERVSYLADAALLQRASDIALQIKHAVQDCIYVACAERCGADVVTADATLLSRAAPHFPFVKPL
jgi:predicted nucleic acid-binding protein